MHTCDVPHPPANVCLHLQSLTILFLLTCLPRLFSPPLFTPPVQPDCTFDKDHSGLYESTIFSYIIAAWSMHEV